MSSEAKVGGVARPAPLVSVRSLARRFETGAESLEVLTDVNLDVPEGATAAITGESGCGKSTLLALIGGLDRPTSGSVRVGQTDVTGLEEAHLSRYRSREIGFIFQFHFLLKDFTALENVIIPGDARKRGGEVPPRARPGSFLLRWAWRSG